MESNGGLLRVVALTLVAVAIWFIGRANDGLPAPRGLDAPATEFSAARAYATLGRLLGPEVPHPVSSAANADVRNRVRAEFDALHIPTLVNRAVGCNGRQAYGFFACGTTEDVIAEVAPGEGKAIVLVAHYDSVPAGPGASDDQSGVATILETVRALKARGLKTDHPIIAVITDGEEAGLLGAAAFVNDPQFRDRIGVVVNVEARGNQGPSLLFQTSPGDGRLIDLYARSVPEYATSSLFAVIYRLLPNDTDLTVFLNKGFTGFNFAFSGNVAHYHTPLDRRANLSQATLQMHGDNLIGTVTGLMQTDFDSLKGGDAVYLTLLGHLLPRMPASWALPLAVIVLAALAFAAWRSNGDAIGIGRRLAAFAIPPAVLVGAAAFGWLLHAIASLVSGQPDPGYADPAALRIALMLGVLAATLLASRFSTARLAALSVWLWIAVLGLVTAYLLPGLSPYFLLPALGAAILLPLLARTNTWTGLWADLAMFVAALLPLLIWLSLSAMSESIQGLALHPLITITAAFAALTLLPLLAARPLSRGVWQGTTATVAAAAVVAAVVAGLQPAYSTVAPQRLNIDYVEDHVANKAQWALETGGAAPAAFRAVLPFSDKPEQVTPLARQAMVVAPAGALRFHAPSADAVVAPQGKGRVISLVIHASDRANRVVVIVPKTASLTRVDFRGQVFVPGAGNLNPAGTIIACVTDDCRTMRLKLTFATAARVDLTLGEQTYGLPPDGLRLVEARPNTTIPSQSGDSTIVFGKLNI